MKSILNKLALSLWLIVSILGISSRVLAQTQGQIKSAQQEYTVLAPLPCIPSTPAPGQPSDAGVTCKSGPLTNEPQVNFRQYIQYMFNLLIAVAAVAAVVMIVYGGIMYMITTSFTDKKANLDKVKHAIYGLLLILASYLILRTVDPRFVAIPNSLVPQLQIEHVQPLVDLADELQAQTGEYVITSQDLGQTIGADKALIADKQKQLDAVNKQLSDIYSGDNAATPDEINKLTLERQQLTNDISAARTDMENATAQQVFNGIIGGALSDAQNTQYSVTDVVNHLNTDLNNLKKYRDTYTSNAQKNGNYDISSINNSANYTEARLNLLIADEMTSSLTTSNHYSSGTGGYIINNGTGSYVVEKPDGSGSQSFASVADAKTYIQTQIARASADLSSITDQKLQADLQTKIQASKDALAAK